MKPDFWLKLSHNVIRWKAELTGNPAEPGSPSLPGFPCIEKKRGVKRNFLSNFWTSTNFNVIDVVNTKFCEIISWVRYSILVLLEPLGTQVKWTHSFAWFSWFSFLSFLSTWGTLQWQHGKPQQAQQALLVQNNILPLSSSNVNRQVLTGDPGYPGSPRGPGGPGSP